jgi:hypothetical protein
MTTTYKPPLWISVWFAVSTLLVLWVRLLDLMGFGGRTGDELAADPPSDGLLISLVRRTLATVFFGKSNDFDPLCFHRHSFS